MGFTISDGPGYETLGTLYEGSFYYLSIRLNNPASILEALDNFDCRISKQGRKIKSFFIRTRVSDPSIVEIYIYTEIIIP